MTNSRNYSFTDHVVAGDRLQIVKNGKIETFTVQPKMGYEQRTALHRGTDKELKVHVRGWNDQVYLGNYKVIGRV